MIFLDVILIDDERRVRNHLKNTLTECGGVNIVGEADDITSAQTLIAAHPRIDGIFLDIQLPGGTGFDIVPTIEDMQKVVFVTAYDQYAIRAFEVNALDYVMKPASQERLEQSLRRLRTHKQTAQQQSPSSEQTIALPMPTPETKVFSGADEAGLIITGEHFAGTLLQEHDQLLLKFGSKSRFVLVKDVVFVRSADNYTEVHCSDGAIALMRKTLEEWAASLPGAVFVRIHRSALINVRTITETEQDAGGRLLIRLRGIDEQLTASRNFALGVKEALAR